MLLLMTSCVEDDTNLVCRSDCATIIFRFISNENEPLSGVRLNLNYRISTGGIGGKVRRIVESVSDKNGFINEEFYIEKDELGSQAEGFFSFDIDDSNLNVDRYIRTDNLIGSTTIDLGFPIFFISQRDTIIERTYFFPRKTYLTINLNNFIPIEEDDYFEVRTTYPFGTRIENNPLLDTEYSTGFSGYGTYAATSENTSHRVYAAANQQNIVTIIRRKGGVSTSEDFTIFVPMDNNIEFSFDY